LILTTNKKMEKQELFEKIEDYLKGRLSGDALQLFEKAMANDPEFAEEVDFQRDLLGIAPPPDVVNLRHLMHESYQEFQKSGQEGDKRSWGVSFGKGRMYWAAAASFLVLIAAGIWWMRPARQSQIVGVTSVPEIRHQESVPPTNHVPPNSNAPATAQTEERLKNNPRIPIRQIPTSSGSSAKPESAYGNALRLAYLETAYSPGVLMGGSNEKPDSSSIKLAESAYLKRDFIKAAQILGQLSLQGDTESLKLRAHSYYRSGNYAAAAADFAQLAGSFSYQQDAEWFLLLCYAHQLPASEIAFSTLLQKVTDPDHPFQARANKLKDSLGR